jgi:lantibiotic modifying enzyme
MKPPNLVQCAAEIGEKILSEASIQHDGSLSWGRGVDLELAAVVDSGIFNGRVGEALLFAALARATGDQRFSDAADQTLLPLRRQLRGRGATDKVVQSLGLGTCGLGSILYVFSQISGFLESPSYLEDAGRVARAASLELVTTFPHLDVTWGHAGWILGLLAIQNETQASSIELANATANALIARRVVEAKTGLRAWPTSPYGVPGTGFAHGNSGIACALLRLSAASGIAAYYDAALEAFEFERSLFRSDSSDWMETHSDPRQLMCSWCHGAPGIALARLESLSQLNTRDEPPIVLDLQRALRRTASAKYFHLDTLCCGALGRADCLLEASVVLGNPTLRTAALEMVANVVASSQNGGYRISPFSEPHQRGGMWQGLTGIAYELLRFDDPVGVTSVLTLRPTSRNKHVASGASLSV